MIYTIRYNRVVLGCQCNQPYLNDVFHDVPMKEGICFIHLPHHTFTTNRFKARLRITQARDFNMYESHCEITTFHLGCPHAN